MMSTSTGSEKALVSLSESSASSSADNSTTSSANTENKKETVPPLFEGHLVVKKKYSYLRFVRVTEALENAVAISTYEHQNGPRIPTEELVLKASKGTCYYFDHSGREGMIVIQQVDIKNELAYPVLYFKGDPIEVTRFKSCLIENKAVRTESFAHLGARQTIWSLLYGGLKSQASQVNLSTKSVVEKQLEDWTASDVDQFLHSIWLFNGKGKKVGLAGAFPAGAKSLGQVFTEEIGTGLAIKTSLDVSQLRCLKQPVFYTSQLGLEIEEVKKANRFDQGRRRVFEKLMMSERDMSEGELMAIAHTLCSPESIIRTYMNLDQLNMDGPFKLKVIVTPINPSLFAREAVKALNVINPSQAPKWGVTHTAVLLGPWIVEWVGNSISKPRRFTSGSSQAILVIDVMEFDYRRKNSELEEVVKGFAAEIAHYNTTQVYDQQRNNCQKFVSALLNRLGIDESSAIQAAVGNYLEFVKRTSKTEMRLEISSSNERLKKLHLDVIKDSIFVQSATNTKFAESYIVFDSHEMLDLYVTLLKKNLKAQFSTELEVAFPKEFYLLKAFDRAFHMRYHKTVDGRLLSSVDPEKVQACRPLRGLMSCCPFGEDGKSFPSFVKSVQKK